MSLATAVKESRVHLRQVPASVSPAMQSSSNTKLKPSRVSAVLQFGWHIKASRLSLQSSTQVFLGLCLDSLTLQCSNHRPARNGAGSRGSRLTPALLREIFGWVSAGEYGVRLRAQGKTTMLPPRGLYLNFSEDFEFGRVRLGSGTIFDVLPAHVTPEKVLYALAVGTKWVMFNNARKEVVLTENMRDGCLFMKANVKIKKKTMQIVVEKEGKSYQLQMQGTRIREFDGEDAESSEVSMVEYPSKEQVGG